MRKQLILVPCLALSLALDSGCKPSWWIDPDQVTGGHTPAGGQDAITIDMPFAAGYQSQCVQGVGGSYSHQKTATYYDVDFDTPNNRDDYVFASVAGRVYVHDDDLENNFGRHINLSFGDGTYLVLGHLSAAFVEDGQQVGQGQLLGVEGTTGFSTGDHVHVGRHQGDAAQDAVNGTSLTGLAFRLFDRASQSAMELITSEMVCGLPGGDTYGSLLATPLWHPEGTLVKTPSASTVYLLTRGRARPFLNEEAFWSRNFDFTDIVLITEDELGCYGVGDMIEGTALIRAAYEDGQIWLVFDDPNLGLKTRQRVRSAGWQVVLKSYGLTAESYNDLPGFAEQQIYWQDYTILPGFARFRDGALLTELSSSDVYAVADGVAMPIVNWETYLMLGFGERQILEVETGLVASIQGQVGNCQIDSYCITSEDVQTCGGLIDPDVTLGDTGTIDTDQTTPGTIVISSTADTATTNMSATADTGTITLPTDTGTTGNGSQTLRLVWAPPLMNAPDRITLSGEYTLAIGASYGWQQLAENFNSRQLVYERPDVHAGDSLRFSFEYEASGALGWSCLAPFPPGGVNGSLQATVDQISLVAVPTADPTSNGCGLTVTIP